MITVLFIKNRIKDILTTIHIAIEPREGHIHLITFLLELAPNCFAVPSHQAVEVTIKSLIQNTDEFSACTGSLDMQVGVRRSI